MRINERFNDDAPHLPGHLTADAAFSTVYSTEGFIYKKQVTYNQKTQFHRDFHMGNIVYYHKLQKNCIQVLQ